MRIFSRMKSAFAFICFFCLLALSSGLALGQENEVAEQRRINELAAVLSRARTVIEDAKIPRKEREKLENYTLRLINRGQYETEQVRIIRIDGYLNALQKATDEATGWRRPAKRTDAGADNLKLWGIVWKTVDSLPTRLSKTKSAWKRLKSNESSALGAELSASLRTLKTGIDALRDVRP